MPKVTFISRMTVKPGREPEYETLCRTLQGKVRVSEPDTLYFEFFKLREPRRYAVIESFINEAAEHAHMNSPLLAQYGGAIVDCLDGPYVREYLDPMA
jgi:(4S)-4-hydroxy-5-phosphonooxypentane-2,3-dione isomerase